MSLSNQRVHLESATDILINPATEEKQDDIITAINSVIAGDYPDTPINGEKLVATAGTAVQITNTPNKGYLFVEGLDTNTGKIYIGDSGVSSSNGAFLYATQILPVASNDLSEWYIDSDNDGEGVRFYGAYDN